MGSGFAATCALARLRSIAIAAVAVALALAVTGAFTAPVTAFAQARMLAAYKEEGGIGGPKRSLIVSARGQATVTFGSCQASFHLDRTSWRRLKAALTRTHLHALAGAYPGPPSAADEITYTITVGHDSLRITDLSLHRDLGVKVEPLLRALTAVVSVGERRIAGTGPLSRCARPRAIA